MQTETAFKTVFVATLLCLVCSIVVSTTAVGLKPLQDINREQDKRKNILSAAGLYQKGPSIESLFKPIETVIVDLETGKQTKQIETKGFDQKKAAKDSALSKVIARKDDLGNIKRRSKYAEVYLVKKQGQLSQIILPIHGKGLWSTLYGFIALDRDTTTVKGFAFYQHGETPGLGGEVDNPKWKKVWKGKKVFDQSWKVAIDIAKGAVDHKDQKNIHTIDGLSGATITSVGVENLVKYWLGQDGFGPYLSNIRNEQGGSL